MTGPPRLRPTLKTALVLCAFLAEGLPSADAQGAPSVALPPTIDVGIVSGVREVRVSSEASLELFQENPRILLSSSPGKELTIKLEGGRFRVDGVPVPDQITIQPEDPQATLRLKVRSYRGRLHIRNSGRGGLTVTNEVGLEDYLNGVLPLEASPAWPPETLKAQAVASRSFVAAGLGRHKVQGYDVCGEVHCQVYKGASFEDPRTSAAATETRGEILTHRGKPIHAYFHANCGGRTETPEHVWTLARVPYLASVRCPWGREDPRFGWKARVTKEMLARALRQPDVLPGDIIDLRVHSRGASHRAKEIKVVTKKGPIVLQANALRLALGGTVVRSTLWKDIRRNGSGWMITGIGSGHGVGLCQWGSKGLGERGWAYRRILRHYYKGSRVEKWVER